MNLIFLKYNNYYNRIVKRKTLVSDYIYGGGLTLAEIQGVAFNENDGITTTQIVNQDFDIAGQPDYMIAYEPGTLATVSSRWFVIECVRIRQGQYRTTLYRDVIADWQKEIVNAPIFIEKATLDLTDPLIFNQENMSFNQILQSQTLLKDKTNCAWVVGYIGKDTMTEGKTITTIAPQTEEVTADFTTTNLSGFLSNYGVTYKPVDGETNPIVPWFGKSTKYITRYRHEIAVEKSVVSITMDADGNYVSTDYNRFPSDELYNLVGNKTIRDTAINPERTSSWFVKYVPDSISQIRRNAESYFTYSIGMLTETQTTNVNNLVNKTIYDSSNNIKYRVEIEQLDDFSSEQDLVKGTTAYTSFKDALNYQPISLNVGLDSFEETQLVAEDGTKNYSVVYGGTRFKLKLVKETLGLSVTIDANRIHLEDSPYDMFCIPYGEITVKGSNNSVQIQKTNKSAAIAMATAIGTESGKQFDIQLLPYCPATYAKTDEEGVIYVGQTNVDYITKTNSPDDKFSVILWNYSSQFTFEIPYSIATASTALEKKVNSQCDLYRLCSPNYNGAFDFNVEKNNGVTKFLVSCDYKPYQPVIHVRPNFGGLYCADTFNEDKDFRGLFCGGDFSLAQVEDAWVNYEMQNKNYQQIFDRHITNLEVNQDVQRTQELWNYGFGILGGGAQGAAAGSIGGIPGAIAGAVVGTASSAIGGAVDINLNDKLRTEALDFAKDNFGYQLGNIKAIPDSLTKVSSLTYDNKLFPFIEYYTCTEEEKEALRNKIKYNGMTVGVIGTISKYLKSERTYIKGKLIRLEGVTEDFHVVKVISEELNKGVFI